MMNFSVNGLPSNWLKGVKYIGDDEVNGQRAYVWEKGKIQNSRDTIYITYQPAGKGQQGMNTLSSTYEMT